VDQQRGLVDIVARMCGGTGRRGTPHRRQAQVTRLTHRRDPAQVDQLGPAGELLAGRLPQDRIRSDAAMGQAEPGQRADRPQDIGEHQQDGLLPGQPLLPAQRCPLVGQHRVERLLAGAQQLGELVGIVLAELLAQPLAGGDLVAQQALRLSPTPGDLLHHPLTGLCQLAEPQFEEWPRLATVVRDRQGHQYILHRKVIG
jgi:hypothetical protein